MKKVSLIVAALLCSIFGMAQNGINVKVSGERMLDRLLAYVNIESQSVDDGDAESFPMTEGQRTIARHIYNEVRGLGGKGVKVTLSEDYYLYVDIPSNMTKPVPSVLLMAHMDVTPEAPGNGIKPMVHRNYDGGALVLPGGITLSPDIPQGEHLKDLVGKTIVTSDGSTLLGADDKTGCAILVSLIEELIKNPQFKHGRVMIALSQNEDVGKAALRYDPAVFGDKPDVVIDIDTSTYDQFGVENFTAVGKNYYFRGNEAHPSHGKETRYADALTAAAYFIGLIPPSVHPSKREGKEGYIHCYEMEHPTNANGDIIEADYVIKTRVRYFDQEEGAYFNYLMEENLNRVREAFPFVEVEKVADFKQYDNIAYTMPPYLPGLVQKATEDAGIPSKPCSKRSGSTSSMMVARFPDVMPGGAGLYSGQQSAHSRYEWCCVEELLQLVCVAENIITALTEM